MGRRGRPYSKDPRKKHYMIRINNKEESILTDCCKMMGMGQADVFRTALERMANELIKSVENRECSEQSEKKKSKKKEN